MIHVRPCYTPPSETPSTVEEHPKFLCFLRHIPHLRSACNSPKMTSEIKNRVVPDEKWFNNPMAEVQNG